MKREIKFRGLRTDGKGWVYGFYYEYNGKSIISSEDHSDDADTYYNDEVIPESVSQYTGLKDRDGADVYEGDILIDFFYDETPIIIEFRGGCFVGITEGKEMNNRNWLSFKVIGNIHEPNPHNST